MTVVGNWFTNALRIYAPNIEYAVAKVPAPRRRKGRRHDLPVERVPASQGRQAA